MNKYLFLSMEGVLLTPTKWWKLMAKGYPHIDKFGNFFNELAVHNLKKILDETDAKVIITDYERLDGLDRLRKMWKYRRMPCEVYDCTPHIEHAVMSNIGDGVGDREKWEWRVDASRAACGLAVEAWVLRHLGKKEHWKDRYAILDWDARKYLIRQQPQLVIVDMKEGLTKEDYIKTVKILNAV